jgi:dTDP-4-amino-4,6-dideoxygalactose transaminase
LQGIADKHGLALMYDAAHGFGASHNGKPVGGNGRAEVFSMSPTKLLIAGEGGIVSTNDGALAEQVKFARNYGNPGNYDCLYPGLNARMSEFHAILALKSLENLDNASNHRNRIVNLYRKQLGQLPGIGFQKIAPGDQSSYKDFSIVVDETQFGLSQKQLIKALLAENIHTRVYYDPVLHRMQAYQEYAGHNADADLPNTLYLQDHALSLPLYSDMREDEVEQICAVFKRIHQHAEKIPV